MKKRVNFTEAILVLLIIISVMMVGIIGLHLNPIIPIIISIMILIFMAKFIGFSWDNINDSFIVGVKNGIIPLFIFMLIGILIGVWMYAGIIPTLIVYGFKLINAHWLLPSIFIICALIGNFIGSAFTVVSTLGLAFIGIGVTIGFDPAMIAGAVVSGAVFADKMSPLSATTNLVASIADINLFNHIKNMMWTTIPAFFISLILYFFIGNSAQSANFNAIKETSSILEKNFFISPWCLLPILILLICAFIKMPTIPTLFLNILSTLFLIIFSPIKFDIKKIANVVENGYVGHTGSKSVNMLISHGGIISMNSSMTLVILALSLGGILINLGVLQAIMDPLTKHIKTKRTMILSTILVGIGVNFFIGEQYLSVILTGKAFKPYYKKIGLSNLALGRSLEDGGSVINYLIPWGVAGSFVATTLSVPVINYLPYAFFSLLCPLMSIISGFTGIGLKKIKK